MNSYPRSTTNLWKIDLMDNGTWRTMYYREGQEPQDCGGPTHPNVSALNTILEFIDFNADRHDLVSICGSFYQLGTFPALA